MIKFLFKFFITAITVTNTSCTEKFLFSLDFFFRPKISLSINTTLPRRTSRDRTQRHFGIDPDSGAIYGSLIDHPRRKRELEFATTPTGSDSEPESGAIGIPAEYTRSNSSLSPIRSPPENFNRPTRIMSRNSDSESREYGRRDTRQPSRDRDRDRHRHSRSPGRNDRRRRRNDRVDESVNSFSSHFNQVSFHFERSRINDNDRNYRPRRNENRRGDTVKLHFLH